MICLIFILFKNNYYLYLKSEYNEYELVLYVQNDRNIQQASDERVEVKCAPQELLLQGVVPNPGTHQSQQTYLAKFSGKSLYGGSYIQVNRMLSHNFTLSHISDALECHMDVMKGRIPFLKPIDGFVDLGQDVTVLIKIKELGNTYINTISIVLRNRFRQ